MLSSQFKRIGSIAENERKKFASDLNIIKDELQNLIDLKINEIQNREINEKLEKVEALIVTCGGDGSHIYTKEGLIEVPSVKPESISDPTGCGDAYRAGLLYGFVNEIDLETTGKIASLMGSIKISCYGTQNHSFTLEEFKSRFKSEFGYKI